MTKNKMRGKDKERRRGKREEVRGRTGMKNLTHNEVLKIEAKLKRSQ